MHNVCIFSLNVGISKEIIVILPGKGNWLEVVGVVMCIAGFTVGPVWKLVDELKQEDYNDIELTEKSSNHSLQE